ncbi:alpha/beta fold hydrolase [Polaribacter tangerinus]|uniref:alpha/beta fold hydrolase n=1 Tax=Polaribacter tangerinus TaxID=1920034 RepID=UPI000B4BD07F|nr:alpha/beta hydrolase [Polaribacter tangerinus]
MILEYKNAHISYSDYGKGTAIVLLHGFLENSTMWNVLVPHFSKKNRVVTLDFLGHGLSDCIGYSHSMELLADTVMQVLKKLKIRKSIFIGHSMGGYVALAFAEKYPQKVKGICLLNSTSNADSEERKEIRVRANKMVQKNYTNLVRMSFSNLFAVESKEKYQSEITLALQEALKTPKQGYIAAQEGMRTRSNRNDVLAKSTFPKLMIMGQNDPVLNINDATKEAHKTATELFVFPGGHMAHIENTALLLNTLKEFVKKC